jgi:hypothetical protein
LYYQVIQAHVAFSAASAVTQYAADAVTMRPVIIMESKQS